MNKILDLKISAYFAIPLRSLRLNIKYPEVKVNSMSQTNLQDY